MKLGPDGYTGIAILGTAGTSMALAPFKDKSWAIWACSPGAYPVCAQNRSDVWFEPHRWLPTAPGQFGAPGTRPWFSPEFHEFLSAHKGPVFMSVVQPSIPASVRIPFEELIQKYGPYFWTSTIAYMLAMAIEALAQRAQAGEKVSIGLWGVDMCSTEEWAYQRPGCQHFLGVAMGLGVNIVLAQESDLMRPPTMYGIGEHSPRHIRFLARKAELEAVRNQLQVQHDEIIKRSHTVAGQLAEVNYVLDSWSDDIVPDVTKAVSFSGEYVKPVGALSHAAITADTKEPDAQTTGADVLKLTEQKKA